MLTVLEIRQGFRPEWHNPLTGTTQRPSELLIQLFQANQPTVEELYEALRQKEVVLRLSGYCSYMTYRTWERIDHLGVVSWCTWASFTLGGAGLRSTQEHYVG